MEKQAVTRELFDQVMVPNYNPQQMVPVRGRGCRLWDQQDREYIDMTAGIAVTALGHCHPALVQALHDQADRVWHLSNVFTNEPALRLARRLTELTFAERVFFCNSGAEANEAAFKLARKYAHDHFGPDKSEILSFVQSFHGRTLFTVTVGGQPKYCQGFEPVPGGIAHAPFNDLAAVAERISARTCAVVVEPVQGEGGVIPADPAFLRGLRELCDQHQALLIFDEVQTGVGRTGQLYAYMGTEVVPDILTTAKGLGGGFPIGAMLTTDAIAQSFGVGTHGTTYGGNPLACAVAEAVIEQVNDPALLAAVQARGEQLRAGLAAINDRLGVFADIRGQGLLLGAELAAPWQGKAGEFLAAAREQGVLILMAGPDVLRFAPPLIIGEADIREGLDKLEAAIAALVAAPA